MHSRIENDADLARRSLLAIAALAPALAAGVTSTPKAAPAATARLPPDLARAVHDYDQATTRNDVATLADLVADDYVLVNSDSSLQHKESYLTDFEVPGFRLDPYVIEEPVLKAWGDAALIAGLMRLSWTQNGARQSRLLRVAHVWARQDGQWRMAYSQLTPVPD